MARLSSYGLGDDAVDGGFHVAWVKKTKVGLKLVDARYGKRWKTRDALLEAMKSWMDCHANFLGVDGDVAIFEPKNY